MAQEQKHQDAPPNPPKIKRDRDGHIHIDNCNTGYLFQKPLPDWSTYSNIHHIVSISCMADGTIKEQVSDDDAFKFIKKCLAFTDWDINDGPNVVGLPKKQAYLDPPPPGWHWDGWACHQVDHTPLYLEKVSNRLKQNIWNTLREDAQACKDKGEAIAKQLKSESDYWRGKLSGRCTKLAWEKRFGFEDEKGNIIEENPLWFWPFSMDVDDANPRKPPPEWNKKPGLLGKLGELFEML